VHLVAAETVGAVGMALTWFGITWEPWRRWGCSRGGWLIAALMVWGLGWWFPWGARGQLGPVDAGQAALVIVALVATVRYRPSRFLVWVGLAALAAFLRGAVPFSAPVVWPASPIVIEAVILGVSAGIWVREPVLAAAVAVGAGTLAAWWHTAGMAPMAARDWYFVSLAAAAAFTVGGVLFRWIHGREVVEPPRPW